ncbi:large subunit ribosomal protein L21e, cytoplasmic [Guillardia theta CCMP2712]|uniref:Large subunit ribosomal protein L21e, cytoplasmic n=1 Tax=Guillardia theta (strain CCMP2712) TaxID=905079 RepID=L1IMP2_GUITC|nr:large subunit ribosomal protein L21e, cytoplasmic [Guillardia theta CCMP2712]EKX37159.1 large subunit ribosomal protein L21e, cytoplasmic [Guillardia theta CCMP2712]|eukprot:XP_005824139.1 large subunit ribosomal protein L21e, cytoplasmic [Guillardia theta CCMP2712]
MGCGKARGVRRNTRDMFQKAFGEKGLPSMSTYLTTYKLGDFVDIKVNGAIHKGMPYRYYHGRTGRVWNVTKRALGVMVNKQVKGRVLSKRIHVRIEHVKPSKCQDEFKARVKHNEEVKAKAKRAGKRIEILKRLPKDPKPGYIVKAKKQPVHTMCAVPYELLA